MRGQSFCYFARDDLLVDLDRLIGKEGWIALEIEQALSLPRSDTHFSNIQRTFRRLRHPGPTNPRLYCILSIG